MSSILWLATLLGVSPVTLVGLIVGSAVILALPDNSWETSKDRKVNIEMSPYERVKLAEALKDVRRD